MRIGIDCLYTSPNYAGGVNTYTFGLLNGFAEQKFDHQFVIFTNSGNKELFAKYEKYPNFKVIYLHHQPSVFTRGILAAAQYVGSISLWEKLTNITLSKFTAEVNQHCDVLYCPNTVLSTYNIKVPTILSMHDIQQFHYPEFFTKRELMWRHVNFGASSRHVSYLQASTQFIKDDLLAHFSNLEAKNIVVINEGVEIETFTKNGTDTSIKSKYALPEKFIFFPAQLWKHKNHITVLKALHILANQGIEIPLVMTGAKFSAHEEIMKYIEDNKMSYVHYLGKVSFPELIQLYHNAWFFITAVLYESSSLPALESAAAGLPVIASRTPPNVEMNQKLAMNLFEPQNAQELADLLKNIWFNDALREEQISSNLKDVRYYSWNNVASQYINFIEKTIR
ncbi:glycosyltransferase [Chitinophaga sp. SYP-B3965]|uniref:glycosyltransferase family 4 protein n=1 Tax=Chitinophaga sp. SYP-B3965 TaxID=2663120 RepID=UPI001299BEEE|nr:glycosyltransferase family 1 protein [Chitinophaga sp. SYP-B3965]MRG46922.1 glycosyltransferase [Chitinophaga sp. SYP-B3965]